MCHFDPSALTPDYAATQHTIEEIGEEGLATVDAGSPPFTAFFRFLPQERVSSSSTITRSDWTGWQTPRTTIDFRPGPVAAASPAEVVVAYSADITTAPGIPTMFERYALPYLQEYAAILHAAGKLFVFHTCGDVRALLPMMRAPASTAIDSLSEPPLGNTPFEVAMENSATTCA